MPITWPLRNPLRKYLASIVGSIMFTLPPRALPANVVEMNSDLPRVGVIG